MSLLAADTPRAKRHYEQIAGVEGSPDDLFKTARQARGLTTCESWNRSTRQGVRNGPPAGISIIGRSFRETAGSKHRPELTAIVSAQLAT
jgi:hypothetical protein